MTQFLVTMLGAGLALGLAQTPLTLEEAVRRAVAEHPAVAVGAGQSKAAAARVEQARSGYLPKVSYVESFARSNNPVFVFSSLLTQRQFTESNFAVERLNRPDFLNNFQSVVSVEQTVYDWGATKAQVRSAELGRSMAGEAQKRTQLDVIARVVRAYYGAVLAKASLETAAVALGSAKADLERAEAVKQAGMSTEYEVLSIRVHLAEIREAEIRRGYEYKIAMAALHEAMGVGLEEAFFLTTALSPAVLSADAAAGFEAKAAAERPELRQVNFAAEIAQQQRLAARSGLLPQVGVRGVFEADRQRFVNRGGGNWLVAAQVRWNLFDGYATRAKVNEAEAMEGVAKAQQKQMGAAIRLEVQKAWSEFRAAEERIGVASAAVEQAEESLRITKNRYEAGLATVTDLLRTESALLETKTRKLMAIHDQRWAAVMLELAAGTLAPGSDVLR
ncbi:TolC family protein [Nostoc sp. NIES-2111]